MSRPNHHYVPEMLSKRFRGPQGLWFFDTNGPSRGVHVRNPRTIFCERDFNTIRSADGSHDVSAEEYLRDIESKAAPLLTRIVECIRRREIPALSQQQRIDLTIFVYLMWRRPPEARARAMANANIPRTLEQYIIEFEAAYGRPLNDAERAFLESTDSMRRTLHNAQVLAALKFGTKVLPAIYQSGLHFGRTIEGRSFVVGSNPVIRVGGELGKPNAASILPISHDVVIYFGDKELEGEGLDLGPGMVRAINEAIWAQSSSIAGPVKAQIQSLAKRAIRSAAKGDRFGSSCKPLAGR